MHGTGLHGKPLRLCDSEALIVVIRQFLVLVGISCMGRLFRSLAIVPSTRSLTRLLISSAMEGPPSVTSGNFPSMRMRRESLVRYSVLCSLSYAPQNSILLFQEMLLSCSTPILYR